MINFWTGFEKRAGGVEKLPLLERIVKKFSPNAAAQLGGKRIRKEMKRRGTPL